MGRNKVARVERRVPIRGSAEHVANVLHAYDQRGELLSSDRELRESWQRMQRWRGPAVHNPTEVMVTARLLMPVAAAESSAQNNRGQQPTVAGDIGRALLLAFAALGSAALMIALIAYTVGWVFSTARAMGGSLLGLVLVLFIAWIALSARRGHACSGLHCPGCKG